MLDDNLKKKIVENFERASEEFEFNFVSPHYMGENNEFCFLGYLFRDNLEKGVLIDVIDINDLGDEKKERYCKEQKIFYSRLFANPSLGEYKRAYFREMLRDWRYEF